MLFYRFFLGIFVLLLNESASTAQEENPPLLIKRNGSSPINWMTELPAQPLLLKFKEQVESVEKISEPSKKIIKYYWLCSKMDS